MAVLYRPGEAGRMVGIKPSTLRVYAQRFAELLSDDATAADRPGYRLFTEHDVELLRQARELLDRGFTYERAGAQLRGNGPARPAAPPRRAGPGADVSALEGAVQAWRALAEERGAEVAELRAEVRALQEMLRGQRRPTPIARSRHR
jgi:DNA-binding transcriptional MerR regulator